MSLKIVAPVDGSAASERILPHIAELARAVDAEVSLVHVVADDPRSVEMGSMYLDGLKERAESLFPGVVGELRVGEPGRRILEYAVQREAGLLAIVPKGRSKPRRALFGNTAIDLMRRSQVPLFVARPEWTVRPLRRILVAIDSTRKSRDVLEPVEALARSTRADVVLASVLAPAPAGGEVRALRSRGVSAETLVLPGDPAREILSAARSWNADLVAIGSLGRRATDRFFLGSIAESVLVESDVPVLIRPRVRAARRTAEARR